MIQSLTSSQLCEIVGGSLLTGEGAGFISHLTVDSRNMIQPEATLFVALKGAKFDGHDFIDEIFLSGVKCFLIKTGTVTHISDKPDAVFIAVDEPLKALQKVAAHQRSLFKGPVVGITGSNGKTIVKEWLGQILSQKFAVAKSPKSYNSQVGVPLSLFGIASYHQVAVMEAGISKPAEMEKLAAMIRPDMGIFTNIGTAHEEGFSSQDQKLAEKVKLFKTAQFIIYRKDQVKVAAFLEKTFDRDKLISWSSATGSEYSYSIKKGLDESKILMIKSDMALFTFSVPFTDEASLENVCHAITAALSLGMSPQSVQEGIRHLKAVDMRLTLKSGANESLLIDDTYNNDLAGLWLALEFMAAQRAKKRKVIIISDMLQVGNHQAVYEEVSKLLRHHQIDLIFGVGKEIQVLGKDFPDTSRFFEDTQSLLAELDPSQFDNDLILVTGARNYEFETIVHKLQQRIHGTILEINLNALTHNYNFYKTRLHPKTKVMVMVKAFAYGGGAVEIANHLQQLKADYLAVAYTDEGVILREQGIILPIMVLNPMQESFIHLQKYELEPVVYSPLFFRQIGKYCRSHHLEMKIHLDLDTGMHRLGFEEKHLPELMDLLKEFPELKVSSIYTHLAGADEILHEDYSISQLNRFTKIADQISWALNKAPLRHALNSAGIIRYPEYQMDMVRLGIGLYGVEVSDTFDQQLKPISTLKTTISQIKSLQKEQTVGYSRKGKMEEDGRIATIAIGYADGYDRRFSNGKGLVEINGKLAPVIGNVCMDMCMVDISHIDAKEGDEVIIYGEGISLKGLATRIGTIPYELLTNISSRVKRIYYLD